VGMLYLLIPSKYSPINHSLIIISFDAMQSELLKATSSKTRINKMNIHKYIDAAATIIADGVFYRSAFVSTS
jgi:hypothetical protein